MTRALACPLVALALALPGCTGTAGSNRTAAPRTEAPAPVARPDQSFYEGTPRMQQRAAEAIARFESEDVKERLQAAAALTQLGEPAARPLLRALAESPSVRVRGMAAYTLGFLRDHRALDPLARALSDPAHDVRAEAATALLRNGDDRGLATLIADLEDADPLVRSRAILVLHEGVGEALGFAPDDDPLERQAAVARWKSWLGRRREQAP